MLKTELILSQSHRHIYTQKFYSHHFFFSNYSYVFHNAMQLPPKRGNNIAIIFSPYRKHLPYCI